MKSGYSRSTALSTALRTESTTVGLAAGSVTSAPPARKTRACRRTSLTCVLLVDRAMPPRVAMAARAACPSSVVGAGSRFTVRSAASAVTSVSDELGVERLRHEHVHDGSRGTCTARRARDKALGRFPAGLDPDRHFVVLDLGLRVTKDHPELAGDLGIALRHADGPDERLERGMEDFLTPTRDPAPDRRPRCGTARRPPATAHPPCCAAGTRHRRSRELPS